LAPHTAAGAFCGSLSKYRDVGRERCIYEFGKRLKLTRRTSTLEKHSVSRPQNKDVQWQKGAHSTPRSLWCSLQKGKEEEQGRDFSKD